jgi:Bacterial conjugation TrbI-like protein
LKHQRRFSHMDMHDNDQNHDGSESNPSPQDLAGMMDLDLDADDPVFHRPTEHTVSDTFDSDFTDREFAQEDGGFQDDGDVIDVEATNPEEDPFAKEFNPEKNRTLVGLQNSGFAKAAVVVGGSFAVLTGGAMIFQNQIPKSQVAQEVKKKDPADEKVSSAQAAADKAQQSESEIKAQLALSKQKDSLAQANGSNNSNSNPATSPDPANPTGAKPTNTAATTGAKPSSTNRNPGTSVTVNPPATVANQNVPTAQLAATSQSATNNRNGGATVRRNSAPLSQTAATAKAPTKQQTTQVARSTAIPLAQSASRLLPVVNKESVAQARPTKTTSVAKVPTAQPLTPIASPGVPVAQAKPQAKQGASSSRAVQQARAATREPQSDNYSFGQTASNSNAPAPAQDTRRPLSDVMRNNGNNINQDSQLATVPAPGFRNTAADNNPFGNSPANATNGRNNGNLATTGNTPAGGFGTNTPIENNGANLANAPAPSLNSSLITYLQRSQPPAGTATIAQAPTVAAKPEQRSPVAPVPRVNSNSMDSEGPVAALANVGDQLGKKLGAIMKPLDLARTSTATQTPTIVADTSASNSTVSNLGQGLQNYQRLQPIGQVASSDVDNQSRALLSSRPAFAYTQSVATNGGIDNRGLVAARTNQPVENTLPANNSIAKSILVGTSAKASTVTPILWNAGSNSNAKFIIKLDEPIRDNSGQVALPAGTQLVAIARASTTSAEMADLEVVGVVVQGEEFAPPPGMLTIRNDQNGLIVGQDYFQRGNQIASRDSMIFVTGALGTIGRTLNQPTSTFTSTGLNGTVTSSSNGQPNILGAALEGGFRDLPSTWTQRNQQAIQEIASKPNVYQLPKGSAVRVFVNQTLNF